MNKAQWLGDTEACRKRGRGATSEERRRRRQADGVTDIFSSKWSGGSTYTSTHSALVTSSLCELWAELWAELWVTACACVCMCVHGHFSFNLYLPSVSWRSSVQPCRSRCVHTGSCPATTLRFCSGAARLWEVWCLNEECGTPSFPLKLSSLCYSLMVFVL